MGGGGRKDGGIRGVISKVYGAFWGHENELNLTVMTVAYICEYTKKSLNCTLWMGEV